MVMAAAALVASRRRKTPPPPNAPPSSRSISTDLPAGTILSEQYAGFGVHISAVANGGHPDALIVFDSNAPPTHDPDLAVDIGNIAVLAENVDDNNGDGLVDDPDENNFGGRVTFSFDQDVRIGSFLFVDHDHQPADHAAAYDASGNLITKVMIPVAGNGSVQSIAVNADGVRRFELVYRDSAGFTGIEVECEQPGGGPTPTGGDVRRRRLAGGDANTNAGRRRGSNADAGGRCRNNARARATSGCRRRRAAARSGAPGCSPAGRGSVNGRCPVGWRSGAQLDGSGSDERRAGDVRGRCVCISPGDQTPRIGGSKQTASVLLLAVLLRLRLLEQ